MNGLELHFSNKHLARPFFLLRRMVALFGFFGPFIVVNRNALFHFLTVFGQPFCCESPLCPSVNCLCQGANPLATLPPFVRPFPTNLFATPPPPPSSLNAFVPPLYLKGLFAHFSFTHCSKMVNLFAQSLLSFLLFLLALFAPILFCLEFCGPPLLLPGGKNACPSSSSGLKTIDGREVCCGYSSPVDGHTPEGKRTNGKGPKGKYCGPYLVVDNIPRCPETHPYDDTKRGKDRCCGEKPITQKQKDQNQRSIEEGTETDCADLAAPGRPSDCPANKHRCDEPMWRDLMTEQCPKTCGRCAEWTQQTFGQRGSTALCRDGIGPNGLSECRANKMRCTDPIWRTFMEKECPKTCGVCWKRGRRTTKRWRTTATAPTPSGSQKEGGTKKRQ